MWMKPTKEKSNFSGFPSGKEAVFCAFQKAQPQFSTDCLFVLFF